jgi:hypothetical protein
MGRHTRAEFATICGLSSGNLSNYIKRGKVVVDGEFIDDTAYPNSDFLQKRLEILQQRKEEKKQAESDRKLRMLRPDAEIDSEKEFSIDDDDEKGDFESIQGSSAALNKKKLKVDIAKKIKETKILELREQKIKGEIVPIADVSNIFQMHTQSIVTAQKDALEELLIELSVDARLTGDQLARLRGKMVDILNRAVDKAIIITTKNMKVIAENFAMSREVGEHD